jgi:S-methylmethionine-dependent homocysteine/selenocysteine methylase
MPQGERKRGYKMSKYRTGLPQLDGGLFLTDGGLETCLIYHDEIDLPEFSAVYLVTSDWGRAKLEDYFVRHAEIAQRDGTGFIFESPTWRASPDWGSKIGLEGPALATANRESIALLAKLRALYDTPRSPMVISGCVGPRGDGYVPGDVMTAAEAEEYHAYQIGIFADSEADMISAITITNVPEAIGIAWAARTAGIPVVISFTVETDGRLPTGDSLQAAIENVDAATGGTPAYYMINCAHPDHFAGALSGDWTARIGGLRANASRLSHAELDAATELDDGDPVELGGQYSTLLKAHPQINVVGGCCGTDHRHVEAISHACRKAA